jgi:hypothetical protein
MKRMFKAGSVAFVTMLCFLLVGYTACKKKPQDTDATGPCTSVVCQNNGTCLNGTCQCIPGFEGEYCQTASNFRYVGKWNVTEKIIGSSNTGNINKTKGYTLTIAKGEYNLDLLFNNLSNTYNAVKAVFGRKYNGTQIEYDVYTRYIMNLNQAVSGSANNSIIIQGGGSVNDGGTDLRGTYYVSYKDGAAIIVDTIDLAGVYIP